MSKTKAVIETINVYFVNPNTLICDPNQPRQPDWESKEIQEGLKELEKNRVILRDLQSETQREVLISNLLDEITSE